MKILVTGAAGFIGSTLTEKLLNRGDEVVGLDNFNDYYDPAKKRKTAATLNEYERFRMVEEDILNRNVMLELFEEEQFDAVAHLAAMAGVRNAVKYPDYYVQVDLNGSQHLMDAARFSGVGNFVLASTSSVYGKTKQIPFVETDSCAQPLQAYAAAKRACEMLGYTYSHLYNLNFTAVRFFTVYGPRNRPDMMAYLVAESITKGINVPLYEGGQMWRDWTFVDDIADGVILALDNPQKYEIVNLGYGSPILLNDFITIMEDLAGAKGNFTHKKKLEADVVRTFSDTSKARALYGYNPTVSVEEGVARFWKWYLADTNA